MPIYEYHCVHCNIFFEEWCLRVDDNTTNPCLKCNKEASRIISQTSFALKGEGWYATEYGTMKNKSSETTTEGNTVTPESSTSTTPKDSTPSPASTSLSK